jgi:hypothetical protein
MKNKQDAKIKDMKLNKDGTITIRLSGDWENYIESCADALTKKMDNKITKTWVVTQLMKMGRSNFEKKHNIKIKTLLEEKESA